MRISIDTVIIQTYYYYEVGWYSNLARMERYGRYGVQMSLEALPKREPFHRRRLEYQVLERVNHLSQSTHETIISRCLRCRATELRRASPRSGVYIYDIDPNVLMGISSFNLLHFTKWDHIITDINSTSWLLPGKGRNVMVTVLLRK